MSSGGRAGVFLICKAACSEGFFVNLRFRVLPSRVLQDDQCLFTSLVRLQHSWSVQSEDSSHSVATLSPVLFCIKGTLCGSQYVYSLLCLAWNLFPKHKSVWNKTMWFMRLWVFGFLPRKVHLTVQGQPLISVFACLPLTFGFFQMVSKQHFPFLITYVKLLQNLPTGCCSALLTHCDTENVAWGALNWKRPATAILSVSLARAPLNGRPLFSCCGGFSAEKIAQGCQ